MILLDTNVLSEFMKPSPDARVRRWLDAQRRTDVGTTAIVVAELAAGVAALPEGRRRILLQDALDLVFESLDGRVLPFEAGAAIEYGRIIVTRIRAGRPISVTDAQIAAIAVHADATLATRNVRDFEGTGVRIIDPWRAQEDGGLGTDD